MLGPLSQLIPVRQEGERVQKKKEIVSDKGGAIAGGIARHQARVASGSALKICIFSAQSSGRGTRAGASGS